jgi:hypothetical protein
MASGAQDRPPLESALEDDPDLHHQLCRLYPELGVGALVPHGPLGSIKLCFARIFATWGITLPDEDVAARRRGTIIHQGWTIDYVFGSNADGEHVDYYAHHRMTNDRHARIHEDGRVTSLPALPDAFLAGITDPDTTASTERLLARKGFGPPAPSPLPSVETVVCPAADAADDLAARVTSLLDEVACEAPLPEVVAHTRIDEAWFSNRLAWLLDPTGSHELGERFTRGFLDALATARGRTPATGLPMDRQRRCLRGPYPAPLGVTPSQLTLGQLQVVRELHLAQQGPGRGSSRPRHLDLALLRLAAEKGLFVAIENKLFTADHDDQLAAYHRIVESRYARARVVEYAYLTLDGSAPKFTAGASDACRSSWCAVSWLDDILPILDGLAAANTLPAAARELRDLLQWFAAVRMQWHRLGPAVGALRGALLQAVSEILLDELQRLNAGAPGTWAVKYRGKTRWTLTHSQTPARSIVVQLTENLSVAVLARRKGKAFHDRRIVHISGSRAQFLAIMDLVAHDAYAMHFGDSADHYLFAARRLRSLNPRERERWGAFVALSGGRWRELAMLAGLARWA